MSPWTTDAASSRVTPGALVPPASRGHDDAAHVAAPPAPRLTAQAVSFVLIGGIATLVDVGLFNVLHYGLGTGPILAKILSTVAGGLLAFLGNREFSFGEQAGTSVRRQVVAFTAVSAVALGLALVPLAVTRYLLGMDGALALNIAGNGVGLALATAFRFYGCRRWVFRVAPAALVTPLPAYERARLAA